MKLTATLNNIGATTTRPATRTWLWLGLGATLGLTLLLYLPTLGYYWAADDFNFAVKKDWPQIWNFFNLARGHGFYRPLSWLSFVMDYELWGRNPFMWRLTNIIINLACATLVWLLAYRLRGAVMAAAAGLIFAAQPAHPGSITWIDGRFDALATLMYLGCVVAFVIYMQTRRRLYYDLALISLLLAILAKETGLTAPALLLLADLLFFPQPGFSFQGKKPSAANGSQPKPAAGVWGRKSDIPSAELDPGRDKSRPYSVDWAVFLKAKLWLHLPFIILGGGYLLLRLWLNAERLIFLGYGGGLRNSLLDNLAGYVGMMVGFPSVAGLKGGAAMVFLAGFLIVSVALAWLAGRLAWFGLVWVFVSMAPFANIPIFDQATRYVYLPSVGIALILGAAIGKGLQITIPLPLGGAGQSPLPLGGVRGGSVTHDSDPLPASPSGGGVSKIITTFIAMLIIGYCSLATLAHNDEWRVAGEMTHSFVDQLAAAHPNVVPNSRFFIAAVPFVYKRASVLNAGLPVAVQTTYDDFSLQVYPYEYDTAAFNAAIQQPSNAPGYYFRFVGGTLKEYPSANALLSP